MTDYLNPADYCGPEGPECLPFAVYGTLRDGHGNARIWQALGGHVIAAGIVRGHRLVAHSPAAAFPYAITGDSEVVVELIMVPNLDLYRPLVRRLDMLEGYPDHYRRSVVDVTCIGGSVRKAWMYHASERVERSLKSGELFEVPDGDWNLHVLADGVW